MGAGGGFLLVPILLLIYPNKSPATVTSMSLLVVCANAASGTLAYARQARIDYRSGGVFVLCTIPGAIGGAVLVGYIPTRVFDAMFAILLLVVGLYLMLRRMDGTIVAPAEGWSVVHRELTDADGNTFHYSFEMWKGMALSAGVGFVSSLLGIGGGIIHVPVMAAVLHFPVHIAAATSHFVLMFVAAEGTAVHVANGSLTWDRSLWQAGLIAVGAVPGAQVGAYFSRRIHGGIIIRALAGALLLVGVRLAFKAVSG